MLVWGGSEGGPDFQHAEMLARAGHEVLSLFSFGQPGQPPMLSRVPVEIASRALDWAQAHALEAPGAQDKRIDLTTVPGRVSFPARMPRRCLWGGSAEANAAAMRDSGRILVDRLAEWAG